MPPNCIILGKCHPTVLTVLEDVEKEVYLLPNPDGSPMQDGNGYLYEALGI